MPPKRLRNSNAIPRLILMSFEMQCPRALVASNRSPRLKVSISEKHCITEEEEGERRTIHRWVRADPTRRDLLSATFSFSQWKPFRFLCAAQAPRSASCFSTLSPLNGASLLFAPPTLPPSLMDSCRFWLRGGSISVRMRDQANHFEQAIEAFY